MAVILRGDGSNVDMIVKYMKPGERGYIPRYAIAFDMQGTPYLNLKSFVERKKSKKSNRLLIIRTGPRENDYKIDITKIKESWIPQERPFYDGPDDFNPDIESVALETIIKNTGLSEKKVKIDSRMPAKERLSLELRLAVKNEEYELAAKIRDKIAGKIPEKEK